MVEPGCRVTRYYVEQENWPRIFGFFDSPKLAREAARALELPPRTYHVRKVFVP
jgi:hypothetical protein